MFFFDFWVKKAQFAHVLLIILWTVSVLPKVFTGVHCTVPSFQIDGLTRAKETALQTLVSSCLEFKRVELIRPLQGMLFPLLLVSICFHAALSRWQLIPLRRLRLVTPSAEVQCMNVFDIFDHCTLRIELHEGENMQVHTTALCYALIIRFPEIYWSTESAWMQPLLVICWWCLEVCICGTLLCPSVWIGGWPCFGSRVVGLPKQAAVSVQWRRSDASYQRLTDIFTFKILRLHCRHQISSQR